MSSTSSDTNGESSFDFLVDKEGKNSKNDTKQMSNTSSDTSSPSIDNCGQQLSSSESTPSDGQKTAAVTLAVVKEAQPSLPMDATVNVNLNETSDSPKSRSDSLGGGLLEWIQNNEFITKMAEKAKNSVDTMITTLDPGMKQIIYSGGDINIMVTSDKESKICPIRESFQKVFGRATVSGLSTQSQSIASQPIGFDNGLKAAKERIHSLRTDPNTSSIPQNQVIVSIENFIVDIGGDKWYDLGCIILDDPVLGINVEVYTQMTPIPNECVNQMRFETPIDYAFRSSGYSVTVGAVMAQKLAVPPEQWHQSWTGISRQEMVLQSAVALANIYKSRLLR